jgi:hypothetical protein
VIIVEKGSELREERIISVSAMQSIITSELIVAKANSSTLHLCLSRIAKRILLYGVSPSNMKDTMLYLGKFTHSGKAPSGPCAAESKAKGKEKDVKPKYDAAIEIACRF